MGKKISIDYASLDKVFEVIEAKYFNIQYKNISILKLIKSYC